MFGIKKKIKIPELLEFLSSSQLYADIARNKNDERWAINVKKLSDEQKRELVLYNMIACIESVFSVFKDNEIVQPILANFRQYIYQEKSTLFSDNMKFSDFESLVERRYYEYNRCAYLTGVEYRSLLGRIMWNNISGSESDKLNSVNLGIYAALRQGRALKYLKTIKRKYWVAK